jgi:RNAse (barnase) inhibitor barstar
MSVPSRFVFVDNPRDFPVKNAQRVFVSHRIRRKRELFGVLKRQLGFPDYFGGNWDALHDCLQVVAGPVVLIHDGLPFGDGSKSRRIYLELLRGLTESVDSPWTIVFPTGTELSGN